MNLYLCRGCSASLCLACGTVDVTKDHFYGQVQINDRKKYIFFGTFFSSQGGWPQNARTCPLVNCGSRLWAEVEVTGLKGGVQVII